MAGKNKKNLRMQRRFLLGLAGILVLFATVTSASIFYYQAQAFEHDAYQKADLVMSAIKSTREYVRSVLRPKMYDLIHEEDFIIEAMSSSYVSRYIAENFATKNDVSYRRVAIDARNQNYEANDIERGMISYFTTNPTVKEWHDVMTNAEGQDVFIKFEPVVSNVSCLNCHGKPSDAPNKVIEVYGGEHGFYRQAGDVVGVVSVSLPVDINLPKTKEIALLVVFGVLPAIIFLYLVIYVFFNQVISQNLRNTLRAFRLSMTDERGAQLLAETESLDEVESLNAVALTIADHLQKNHEALNKYAHELYRSKEVLQSVFDGIADPVVLVSSVGDVKLVNKAFLYQYNLDENDSLGNICNLQENQFFPIDDWLAITSSLKDKPLRREVRYLEQIYQIYFYPVEEGVTDHGDVVCYLKDITEERKLEEHIQHTEKIVSMGQVAAGIAHEINNPLGVILCHIDLIRDDENITDESRADLAIIEKHIDSCRRIVSDLLRFSKPSASSKYMYSVNDTIGEVVSMMLGQLAKQNIEIKTSLVVNMPEILLDVDRFKQVILNLILNSSFALKDAGIINISTYINNGEIIIEVADNGTGIGPDVLGKVFEPFFSTKQPGEGTGLGLAVSYGIIKSHSGNILVDSKLGEGTKFTISIPIEENTNE